MADKKTKTKTNAVDSLLAAKQQLEEWIERLDLAGDEVTEEVRIRVKNDYDGRLAGIMEELHQYAGELEEALKLEVASRETLWEEERHGKEKLSEAQLRHTVGEHSDKEWQEIQAEVDDTLTRVGAGLEKATGEISRLEDVLGAMTSAPKKAEDPASKPAAAKPSRKGTSTGKAGPQRDAFKEKELTLIKSDTANLEPARVEPEKVAEEVIKETIPRPSSIGIEMPLPKADKTLKCGECNAMNFPTEWYCESCGAELASL